MKKEIKDIIKILENLKEDDEMIVIAKSDGHFATSSLNLSAAETIGLMEIAKAQITNGIMQKIH